MSSLHFLVYEQVPDSVDVPSSSMSKFYNPEKAELAVNMVFKDKNDLIASVKYYSIRVMKREYRVSVSTPEECVLRVVFVVF